MRTTGKMFDKICLKAIRDTFLEYVVCDVVGVRNEGKGKNSIFW